MRRIVVGVLVLSGGVYPGLSRADEPAAAPQAADVEAPADNGEFKLSRRWAVLVDPRRAVRGRRLLTAKGPLRNLTELELTGPQPGHPFVMGDFTDDGDFGFIDGALQRISGKNAAVRLPAAESFELEGIMQQVEFGGWFFVVGWTAEGRGYLVSSPTLKESGSPWFLSELRGGAAIADTTQELPHFEWLNEQPFWLSVKDKSLSLKVGASHVIPPTPLDNYTEGHVLLGVYDTRYGPKPVSIHSLRMRLTAPKDPEDAGPADPQAPDEAPEAVAPDDEESRDAEPAGK